MTRTCGRTFDESLLSGYLDAMLTQADRQRVELHLQECAACRTQIDEMARLREVTMTTRFQVPLDDQWDERPRSLFGRWSIGLGWLLLLIWSIGVGGFILGQVWADSESPVERLLVFGGVLGFALVFLSVLVDRLKTSRTDPYRRVQK